MTAKPKGTEVAVVVDENSSEKPQQTAANQFIFEIPEENSTYIWYPLCHCSEPFFCSSNLRFTLGSFAQPNCALVRSNSGVLYLVQHMNILLFTWQRHIRTEYLAWLHVLAQVPQITIFPTIMSHTLKKVTPLLRPTCYLCLFRL